MVVIAVDIGGSKIKAAIVSSNLTVEYSVEVPTDALKGKKFVLQNIIQTINLIKSQSKKKVSAIGISLPGVIKDGDLVFGGDMLSYLSNSSLHTILENEFHVPVILANDADCFTLAESTFGAGKDHKKVLGIIWGSGIGSGIVLKTSHSSLILSGAEIGHVKLYDKLTNKNITIEHLAGGLFVEREYFKLTKKKLSMKEIYVSSDKTAKLLIDRMIKSLAKAIAIAVQVTAPDIVVLGGGVSNLPLIAKLKSEVKKEIIPIYAKSLNIKRFEISDDSGIYGAAILALGNKK